MAAVMIPSRQAPDLLSGHWALFAGLGATPKAVVWDNESAVGQWRGGRPQLTEAMNGFRGTLGIKVIQCRPKDPEAKGLVERANGYLETSFLPGRTFASPPDFNTQLADWLARANRRRHRVLGCRPIDRWDADRAAMLALPPVAPVVGWRLSTRLPRDHYVRVDANDYSVHPSVIGRRIEIAADPDRVVMSCDGRSVGGHQRCWAQHQSITDPAHRQAATDLRAAHRVASIAPIRTEVQARNLADYDRMFDLDGEVA
jgi:transposase